MNIGLGGGGGGITKDESSNPVCHKEEREINTPTTLGEHTQAIPETSILENCVLILLLLMHLR